MENRKITGVTFIIVRTPGEILMQLRDGNSKRYFHMWCFPGGSRDGEEDYVDTVVREAKEEFELDLKIESCHELMVYHLSYGSGTKVFVCKIEDNQKPIMHEGADMRWMKLGEIKNLELGFEQSTIIPQLENFLSEEQIN